MSETTPLHKHLRDLAARSRPGDRLPPIRKLMSDFGVSQVAVQRAMEELKAEGLVDAHVGRGTFFRGALNETAADDPTETRGKPRSVLILHRDSPGPRRRARVVLDNVLAAFRDNGGRTMEISYSDPEHARQVLHGLPKFDACVVQNAFQEMPIEMLAAIRRKTDNIIVDGTWLVGSDVDAVGFEWGEPLERAIDALVEAGHERVVYVATTHPFLANELGRRRYAAMGERPRYAGKLAPPVLLPEPALIDYERRVVDQLCRLREANGRLPFTGAAVWGIESGSLFLDTLERAGIKVPDTLSIILLGRTDIETEHEGFFETIGYAAAEQSAALREMIRSRWREPDAPHGLVLTPTRHLVGRSIGRPTESV
ncbi:GntR family transcriptional regulator [Azospirillum griseum]|uniref:GntR family transcriptional regulator n=1 Tax=Azospirillum griseum TaxID=2496639 RepID=A0A431VB98_9PROT|nr:GntR family transcriptional regulator [Azospirillum griseum]RTR15733.1 GntR family transcriptional regulator [Azospirillum griseum]